ncbi:MAG: hypothetical protein WCC64_18260 [Aliidongia sp.]
MSIRLLSAVLIMLVSPAVGSAADGPDPYAGLLEGPATSTALSDGNGQLARDGCTRAACIAVGDLVTVFDILLRRDVPNTMVRTKPQTGNPDKLADSAFRRSILQHPERFAGYCSVLTKLAAHYSDYTVGFHAVEIATRLDTASKSIRCTAAVIAAFPRTQPVAKMIEDARQTCNADKRAGCETIHQP